MSTKLTVLFSAFALFALTAVGLAAAADEKHGPAGEGMEKIQKYTNNIRKAVRTPAQWKKDAGTVAKEASEIEKLAKDAKKLTVYATQLKKPQADWDKFSDEMIKASADLSTLAKKKDATQAQAKEAFNTLNKSCTACHGVFRTEE